MKQTLDIPIIDINPFTKCETLLLSATKLKGQGIYKEALAYRSFSPKRLEHVLVHGTDRDDCSPMWELSGTSLNPKDVIWVAGDRSLYKSQPRIWDKGNPCYENGVWTVSIYDLEKITPVNSSEWGFQRNGERPLAILRILMKGLVTDRELLRFHRSRTMDLYCELTENHGFTPNLELGKFGDLVERIHGFSGNIPL